MLQQATWAMAAVAVVRLFPDLAGTIDVSNRAEVRGRSTQNVSPNPSLDIVDTPAARAALTTRSWAYTFGYAATFLDSDVEVGSTPPLVLQSGDVGATWHDQRATLEAAEYAAYGFENSATTGPIASPTMGAVPPTPTVPVLAQPANVQFGSSRSVLKAIHRLSRRWTLSLSVEYGLQGGLDTASQAFLPLVRGPRGELTVGYALSRRDALDSRVSAQRSDTSLGPCSPFIFTSLLSQPDQPCSPSGQIGQAMEAWSHQLSPATTMSVGGGVAVAQVRLQEAQAQFDDAAFPVATAGVQYSRLVDRVARTFRLDVAAAPFVDLRTGVVDERAQVTGTLRLPTHTVIYSGNVGAARSIESPYLQPITSIQTAIEAEYVVSPLVGIGGGVRYAWQNQEGQGAFSLAMIFAQVTLRTPRWQF